MKAFLFLFIIYFCIVVVVWLINFLSNSKVIKNVSNI